MSLVCINVILELIALRKSIKAISNKKCNVGKYHYNNKSKHYKGKEETLS